MSAEKWINICYQFKKHCHWELLFIMFLIELVLRTKCINELIIILPHMEPKPLCLSLSLVWVVCRLSIHFVSLLQIKTGAPCRSERLAKYNQLMRSVQSRKDVLWGFPERTGLRVTAELNPDCMICSFIVSTFNFQFSFLEIPCLYS